MSVLKDVFVNNLQNEIITDIDLHSANYYGKHRDPISKLLKNLGMKLESLVMIRQSKKARC